MYASVPPRLAFRNNHLNGLPEATTDTQHPGCQRKSDNWNKAIDNISIPMFEVWSLHFHVSHKGNGQSFCSSVHESRHCSSIYNHDYKLCNDMLIR